MLLSMILSLAILCHVIPPQICLISFSHFKLNGHKAPVNEMINHSSKVFIKIIDKKISLIILPYQKGINIFLKLLLCYVCGLLRPALLFKTALNCDQMFEKCCKNVWEASNIFTAKLPLVSSCFLTITAQLISLSFILIYR